MATIDNLRNNIISKLLTINNKEYLHALYKLVSNSQPETDLVTLTEEQKILLEMSEDDIKNGRIISQKDLDEADLAWLKEK